MTELIVVLDVDTSEEALGIVERCDGCAWFKVGAQLYTRCGPDIVRSIHDLGRKVMLDLKYHDIPNTVRHAVRAAADLCVGMVTVHALGGKDMIAAACEAVGGTETRVLAVTVLTSHSEEVLREELGLPERPDEAVPRLARMAVESGAHGIVCSPLEVELVRGTVGSEVIIVTPGVRPRWSSQDDQVRVMTPGEAAVAGSNYLVVGRPILTHADPAVAVALIQEELGGD